MNPNQAVTIYISAASDLMAEREALARLIAELPVTLAWRIVQSPVEAEPIDTEALLNADLYFVLMGADIRAPVGLELHTAQRARMSIVGFAKRGVAYTPAGQIFMKDSHAAITWQPFKTTADLLRQVQRTIIEHLLRHAARYTLTPPEMANLQQLLTQQQPNVSTEAEGTGHSAVILSRERFIPSEGIIIEE
ncbi:MAG: hypothetical protein KDJ52_16345 [Anaerolineae bacterium]|nr:hypothetical protein [Anaerolineae bacterium]